MKEKQSFLEMMNKAKEVYLSGCGFRLVWPFWKSSEATRSWQYHRVGRTFYTNLSPTCLDVVVERLWSVGGKCLLLEVSLEKELFYDMPMATFSMQASSPALTPIHSLLQLCQTTSKTQQHVLCLLFCIHMMRFLELRSCPLSDEWTLVHLQTHSSNVTFSIDSLMLLSVFLQHFVYLFYCCL